MSESSLWVIDKNLLGGGRVYFNNSWLFAPIAMDILFQKYLPSKAVTPYGKTNFITASMFDKTIFRDLNKKINNSNIQEDRVVWEIVNQQIFFSKDKKFVSNCIVKFLEINKVFRKDLGDAIFDRFKEISKEVLLINEKESPYFLMKNTSVDDNVEYWFEKYDEKTDEYIERSLKELDEIVTEFVLIKNNSIQAFINNIDFKNQQII